MANKLFIVYRVEFNPQTNQELLGEVANAVEERMYDMFDLDDEGQPVPMPLKITHELEMVLLEDTGITTDEELNRLLGEGRR